MDLYIARDRAAALAWSRAGGKARFFCLNWEPWTALAAQGLPAEIWEDRLTPELDRALLDKTISLADSWHVHDGKDFTLFEGLSLGKAARWLAWTVALRAAYKFAAGLKLALDRERPSVVHCETGVPRIYRDALEAVRKKRGDFRVEPVAAPEPGPGDCAGVDAFRWSPPPLTLPAGKRWACAAHNALAGVSSALLGGSERPAVLVSSYHSLEPLLELSSRPGHPLRYQFADIPPKRLAPGLARAGARIVLEAHTPPRWSAGEEANLREMERAWESAQADPEYRTRFDWEGLPLWPAIGPRLQELAASLLRPLAWAARGLASSWRRDPPSLVLVPSDGPPLQHLLTDLARLHRVPSVLLCHGLPASYAFPLENQNPSHLLVWGQGEAAGFEGAGGGRDRNCVVIGNPWFDRYAGPTAPPAPQTPIRKILVLTHPVVFLNFLAAEADPERQTAAILGELAAHPDFQITVKLHPAESLSYYRRCFSGRFPGVRFILDAPMRDCIEDCDLMIGSFSTALLEAMILDTLILCANMTRSEFVPPFDGTWGLPALRSAQALRSSLTRLRADPAGFREETLSAYPKILKAFAGPLDGRAALKVAEGLAKLASRS